MMSVCNIPAAVKKLEAIARKIDIKKSPEALENLNALIASIDTAYELRKAVTFSKAKTLDIYNPYGEESTSATAVVVPKASGKPERTSKSGFRKTSVDGVFITAKELSHKLLKSHPKALFVFGDNDKRYGKRGQAVIRNEPNSIGLRTKKEPKEKPAAYYTDNELQKNKDNIDADIKRIQDAVAISKQSIVFPSGKLGTGMSKLQEKAPKTLEYLNKRLYEEFGVDFGVNHTNTSKSEKQPEGTHIEPTEQKDSMLDKYSNLGSDVDKLNLGSRIVNKEGYKFKTGNKEFTTNEGQTAAIDDMADWYTASDKSKPHFLLQGRGGTGKTTVINVLLDKLGIGPDDIMFVTPTHKALKVLRKANGANKYGDSAYKTIAALLGLQPIEVEGDIVGFSKDPYADTTAEMPKIVVLDETSMVHSANYQMLIDEAEDLGTSIIFMGDHAQLPPIKDPHARIRSVVFDELSDSTTHLNELMRQDKDSPIVKFTDRLIELVLATEKMLEQGKQYEEKVKIKLRDVVFDADDYTIDKDTGEGVVLTSEGFEDILPHFVADYNKNPKGTKYIHYNKHTNENTIDVTTKIRKAIYGEAANQQYIAGEPLVLNGPTTSVPPPGKSLFKMPTMDNGEEFTVVSSTETEEYISYTVGRKVLATHNKLKVTKIVATDNVTGDEVTFFKPLGTDEDFQTFVNNERSYLTKLKLNDKWAYRIKSFVARDLTHGYVVNGHKAQGSTYENVYLNLGNMLFNLKYADANSTIKAIYVGASRPEKRLVVMDNRGNNSSIANSSTLGQTNNTLDANTGTVSAVKNELYKCE